MRIIHIWFLDGSTWSLSGSYRILKTPHCTYIMGRGKRMRVQNATVLRMEVKG